MIINFKDWNKIYLDSFRMVVMIIIVFFEFDQDIIVIILISLLIVSDLIRTWETFENVYKSTHYIIMIIQLWISIIVLCTCFLKSIYI